MPKPTTPAKPAAAGKTSTMPYRKQADQSKDVTSERIADHLEAFRAAGGTIEVLGVTPVLKRLAAAEAAKP
jgi:hypothetical protein